jgi:hypothetical protein
MNSRLRLSQLYRYRTDSIISYYDNHIENETESKWTIVRQRLPDVLALSTTYKPTNVRTQLILLMALMKRQSNELRRLNNHDCNTSLSHVTSNVVVNIGGRSRFINLKRIPSEQMIHVDIDGLTFSIPTRQFIIAISRGNARETAAKYCPPAISDMLINLSKTKVADDGRQYKRALFKSRIGKMLFFSLFIFIIGMILALIIGAGNTLWKLNSLDHTNPNLSITTTNPTHAETNDYLKSR